MVHPPHSSVIIPMLAALALATCGPPSGEAPAAARGRYEFTTDRQGRTLRLDTVTGETVVVGQASRRQRPAAPGAGPAEADSPALPEPVAPEPSEPDSLPSTDPPAAVVECVPEAPEAWQPFVAIAGADAFLEPDARNPVASLPAGTAVTAVGREGSWWLVRFADSSGGERTAFVHCRSLRPTGLGFDPGRTP